MWDWLFTLAALVLAAFSAKQYRFVGILVAFEFLMHEITYNYLFLELRSENSVIIYVLYMVIQAVVLMVMYVRKTHFSIALLIFLNLFYNFLVVLQYIGIANVNFYGHKNTVMEVIMILELLYLLGINSYVSTYLTRNGYFDIDALDSLLLVWRRPNDRNLVQGQKERAC